MLIAGLIMEKLIKKLDCDKIQIHWNKNPIKMKDFLSFLTVDVVRSRDHLGCENGWTQHHADDNLIIGGGMVGGVEYLDSLRYKKNLDNPYNNYVNPFFLFEIMNEDGKKFFLDYYREDILKILDQEQSKIEAAKKNLAGLEENLRELKNISEGMGLKND